MYSLGAIFRRLFLDKSNASFIMILNEEVKKSKYYFECNICFNLPAEPISTFCGHIFCWPCFYSSEHNKVHRKCPLCRKTLQLLDVIPMKITNDAERYSAECFSGVDVPPRPVFYKSLAERNVSGEIDYKSFGRKKKECKVVHVIPITKKMLVYAFLSFSIASVIFFYEW